jgi:hypothetical protein
MNPFQNLFDMQKAYFASNITRTYKWRIEQLDRMDRLICRKRWRKILRRRAKNMSSRR